MYRLRAVYVFLYVFPIINAVLFFRGNRAILSIAGERMADIYYISDSAYEKLLQLASDQGFTKFHYKSHRGLSDFLNKLSYSEFIDTRSEFIKERHSKLLKEHRRPQWAHGLSPKLPRCLTLTDEAIYNYVETALRLKIHLLRRLVRGGQPNRSAVAICGLALEALGAGFIHPVQVPIWSAPAGSPVVRSNKSSPKSITDSSLLENPYIIYLRKIPKKVAEG